MKCEFCGAPINFNLGHCAYCGNIIPQRFGRAFPVKCPWNGTKTCGIETDHKGRADREWFSYGVLIHCAHCHANEPHPVSPEGILLHSPYRRIDGKVEMVCPGCLKLGPVIEAETFEPAWWPGLTQHSSIHTSHIEHYAEIPDSRPIKPGLVQTMFKGCSDCASKVTTRNRQAKEKWDAAHLKPTPAIVPADRDKPHWWRRSPGPIRDAGSVR